MATDGSVSAIQRALGILLALLVGISLPIALTLRSFSAQLFAPERFESALVRNLTATGTLRRLAVQEMLEDTETGAEGFQQLTADMTEEEVDRLLRMLMPDAWWEAQLRSGVNAFYGWVDSSAAMPEFTLNLEPVRARLLGEAGSDAVDLIMASWQPCTPSQLQMMAAGVQGDGDLFDVRCLPPEPYQSILQGVLLEGLREEAGTMPPSVRIGPAEEDPDTATEFVRFKRNLRTARWLGNWGWMVPVAVLGLIMAVNVYSLKTWGLWWGPPLMVAGTLSLLITLFLAGPVETRLVSALAALDTPNALRSALGGVVRDLFQNSLGRLMFWGIATGGIGLVLTLTGVFAPGRKR